LISTVELQLVKAIILDINNLYPGNGNRQAVLTSNHSQDMNSLSTIIFSRVKMILIDIRN